jgi:hypothetical protein
MEMEDATLFDSISNNQSQSTIGDKPSSMTDTRTMSLPPSPTTDEAPLAGIGTHLEYDPPYQPIDSYGSTTAIEILFKGTKRR